MEYNTTRNKLVIPEYGRHIQRMIEQTCLIEDREMRNLHAQSIVNVMGTMLPHLRDVVDFKHKLWDHLFIISNFKLDVDSPFPIPSVMTYQVKPKKLSYPTYKNSLCTLWQNSRKNDCRNSLNCRWTIETKVDS